MKQLLEELNEVLTTLHADIKDNPNVSVSLSTSISNSLVFTFRWENKIEKNQKICQYAIDIDDIPPYFSKDDFCGHLSDIVDRSLTNNQNIFVGGLIINV